QTFAADADLASAHKDVVGMLHELRSAMDALEARAVTALAESLTLQKQAEVRAHTAHEEGAAPPTRRLLREAASEAAREVSMLIGKSPAAAAHSLASQRRLVSDMPEMLSALATAQVTSTTAHSTARSFAPLTPAQRLEADRELAGRLPDLDGAGAETCDDATAAAIAAADPDGQERRHQHARQERHVTVRRGQHGMATVSARVSALDATLIRKRLSHEAERLRAAGDRRGHQAIQADSFADTLIGRREGMEPITLDIGIIITDRALLDPGAGDLARIEGYGTVPVAAVREELRGVCAALADGVAAAMGPDGPALRAVIRRLYTHPLTGELVAVESRARAFTEALARFVRWRSPVLRGAGEVHPLSRSAVPAPVLRCPDPADRSHPPARRRRRDNPRQRAGPVRPLQRQGAADPHGAPGRGPRHGRSHRGADQPHRYPSHHPPTSPHRPRAHGDVASPGGVDAAQHPPPATSASPAFGLTPGARSRRARVLSRAARTGPPAPAAAFAAPGSTAAIRSSTSGVCAVETNQASNAEGGR